MPVPDDLRPLHQSEQDDRVNIGSRNKRDDDLEINVTSFIDVLLLLLDPPPPPKALANQLCDRRPDQYPAAGGQRTV